MQSAGDQRVAGGRGPSLNFGLRGITVADLRSLLNPGALDLEDDEDDEDYRPDQDSDDESAYYDNYRPRQWFPPVLEPQDEGVELLKSGDFGRVGTKMNGLYGSGNLARTIINRSTRPQPYPALYKEDYASVCPFPPHVSISAHRELRNWCQTAMVQLSQRTMLTYTPDSTPKVLFLVLLSMTCSDMSFPPDSSFYYTCSQGNHNRSDIIYTCS